MTPDKAYDLIKTDLNDVEEQLVKMIDTQVELINEVVLYLLSSGGKRLRPAFLILSAKMCGYNGDKASKISTVIEYIHTATLLHDDIIDGARYRRGKPSANNVYGNDIAVLCGDFLYSRGYITLTEYGDKPIQKLLASAAMIMSEGEVIQLLKTADINITMQEYIKIIRSKTAVLFSAACETGARLAQVSEDDCKKFADFGHYLGLAFQMSDDILDYLGDPSITGKACGTDLYEGKLTLPLILLLKKIDKNEKNIVSDIFLKDLRLEEDLSIIVDLLKKYDIEKLAELEVNEKIEKSLNSLASFPDSEYKDALQSLARGLIQRKR